MHFFQKNSTLEKKKLRVDLFSLKLLDLIPKILSIYILHLKGDISSNHPDIKFLTVPKKAVSGWFRGYNFVEFLSHIQE